MATASPLPLPMSQLSRAVSEWVDSVRELTQPSEVHWCEGTRSEREALIAQLVREGQLQRLDAETFPDCYLYRSDPGDVARVEHLTYICTATQDDAGPNNNWMDPQAAHEKMRELFRGCMRGRTLYVIPY
ncbi:MAG: phosphoenolpyruvate carboxykinase, partial [Pseudomonadota bacterium]|nr:phosphoenolpyruvate carboxykinase [Pseudomonadota bacterium]